MAGPETRVRETFPLAHNPLDLKGGTSYNTGAAPNVYDFGLGDFSMEFDFPEWPPFPEPLPEEDPPGTGENAEEEPIPDGQVLVIVNGLRFASGTTRLQKWDGEAWVDVTFPTSDPGGDGIWLSAT